MSTDIMRYAEYRYCYLPRLIENRDVHAFALKAHANLYGLGLTDVISITGQEETIYAVPRDDAVTRTPVVGVVLIDAYDNMPVLSISLAYVELEHHGVGIFRRMMSQVVSQAKMRGCTIEIGTHVKNARMNAILARVGAMKQFAVYEYPLD